MDLKQISQNAGLLADSNVAVLMLSSTKKDKEKFRFVIFVMTHSGKNTH